MIILSINHLNILVANLINVLCWICVYDIIIHHCFRYCLDLHSYNHVYNTTYTVDINHVTRHAHIYLWGDNIHT